MVKRKNSGQLPLLLPLEAAQARDDLVVSDANRQAVKFVDAWPDWPTPIVLLAGPVGAGKTHLANIWAARSDAQFISGRDDGEEQQLPQGKNFVVEDIVQGAFSETRLFHLINAVRAVSGTLLLTSRRWPAAWGVALPDLQSRLKLIHIVELNEPDDALLWGIMGKLFSDRQMNVELTVLDYLCTRMERSLAYGQALVAEIDRQSLAQKRPVTIPLAAEAMQALAENGL